MAHKLTGVQRRTPLLKVGSARMRPRLKRLKQKNYKSKLAIWACAVVKYDHATVIRRPFFFHIRGACRETVGSTRQWWPGKWESGPSPARPLLPWEHLRQPQPILGASIRWRRPQHNNSSESWVIYGLAPKLYIAIAIYDMGEKLSACIGAVQCSGSH